MIPNTLPQFGSGRAIPSSNHDSGDQQVTSPLRAMGFDALSHGAPYAENHAQTGTSGDALHLDAHQPINGQHAFGNPANSTARVSAPIRRRITRACDQCNQLRTKCNGQQPCGRCSDFRIKCEYNRERKKRGKASRKELAQQAALPTATPGHADQELPTLGVDIDQAVNAHAMDLTSGDDLPSNNGNASPNALPGDGGERGRRTSNLDSLVELSSHQPYLVNHLTGLERNELTNSAPLDLHVFGNSQDLGLGQQLRAPVEGFGGSYGTNQTDPESAYADLSYTLRRQGSTEQPVNGSTNMEARVDSRGAYAISSEMSGPGWTSIPSTTSQAQFRTQKINTQQQLRYPVLTPLLPHLVNVIPVALACDLIDHYFACSSNSQPHPMSPYVLGFVFRKRSVLHSSKPRRCQPALLASMLWVAAQTSEAPALASAPSARGKICHKLLELIMSLLKPHIQATPGDVGPHSNPTLGGVLDLGSASAESGPYGNVGTIDDVVTYMHLATVVSASEYKGSSLRWWNAAWLLARELKLGRELPPSASYTGPGTNDGGLANGDGSEIMITEEEREERRRIWWLAYIVDRHLALCYNRPLFLLDVECQGLLQPLDDTEWQNGDICSGAVDRTFSAERFRGPHYECTGHSIFGYFLPLMTILGEIVDLHHARNHPRFNVFREWDFQAQEITRHLEEYERSLKRFEHKQFGVNIEETHEQPVLLELHGDSEQDDSPSARSGLTNISRTTESETRTKTVISYSTHVMHVLHILLTGKWDPINLLDDNDLWISTPSFITATGHAVSAAEAINSILEYDPGLEFMPFFFGIYLLQGSFLLLLIADKLQAEASESVAKACESIIRAHQACVVTLNTEYQRRFSKVMRSALAQVRGRVPEDLGDQHQRRRELLSLYRWTGDGTGLAL
ncbi:fungal-specific transcription factor domain-containing protein [Xylariales sp. PMI_506]|nr:fungal-specific transcription factor domain-containing protein [Xylariales sp. PMI_506]